MNAEDKTKLKYLIIGANGLLSELTRKFDEIDDLHELNNDISNKVGASLTILKAVIDLLALKQGDITGKELQHESDI